VVVQSGLISRAYFMGQDLVTDVSLDRSSHSKKTPGKLGVFAARQNQPAKNEYRRYNLELNRTRRVSCNV